MEQVIRAAVILAAITLVVMYAAHNGSNPSPPTPEPQWKITQRAAANCWTEYDRKVFDPATKRFIAGACEKLDAEYLRQRQEQ
jgi:hypothetical protein